ncbi:MAG: MBL fold metallo-hydrolase [Pseudomonas sp.]|uniref:MBL fold metallo-hydrolase n=1 Tax=Pseudomonas sp. TaxID=306 RepID=UPI00339B7DA1
MFGQRLFRSLVVMTAVLGLFSGRLWAAAPPLQLEVYNPAEKAIFPVSSVLVSGEKDLLLIDAQFARGDAERLVQRIRASGKRLVTIYISHGDPDFYFGLDVLQDAFPGVKILASAPTIAHIEATRQAKLAYWGPILKDDAPSRVVVPQPLQGDRLQLEGQTLQVLGLEGAAPDRSLVWIPGLKALVGGVLFETNLHVWMADTQSEESRRAWREALEQLAALQPQRVIPGHFLGEQPSAQQALQFTRDYLLALEAELPKAKDSAALIKAMQDRYPTLEGVDSLVLSAKVLKGEMQWP